MAKIISAKTDQEIEILNGEPIKEACRKLDVLFGCEDGLCGTCMIDIVEGENNLSELTQAEIDLERDEKHRLACQCKIKKGDVKIDF